MSQNFEQLIADFLLAKTRAAAAEARAKKMVEKKKAKLAVIDEACKPLCQKAIAKYNETRNTKIPDGFGVGYDFERKHLMLSVRLRYASGHEPDEEFDLDDGKRYCDALGAILNPLLADAGIPLTLSEISFPVHYYMK